MQTKAEILAVDVVCKQPGRYIGWPTITKAANGDLLTVFSGDRDAHVCMEGKTQMVRSGDQGETWSEPETINNTPVDDRDAGIITLQDGTLVLSWFTSHAALNDKPGPAYDAVANEDREQWLGGRTAGKQWSWKCGHWVRRSSDHGRSWDAPVRVAATAPHGPIELADGRLLFVGNGEHQGEACIVAEISDDGGRSWRVESTIPALDIDGEGGRLCEPHAVETSDGRILALFRYERQNRPDQPKIPSHQRDFCVLWQAESDDGGKSWSSARSTGLWGKPPHLTRLRDGRLLLTYGHRREPYGERACVSYDDGENWDYDHEIVLTEAASGDLGYPASLELDDGTLLTVYYEKDRPDEKTCLKVVRWQLG